MTDTSNRGLASADKATRQRVARMGGEASRGGGRKRRQNSKGGKASSEDRGSFGELSEDE